MTNPEAGGRTEPPRDPYAPPPDPFGPPPPDRARQPEPKRRPLRPDRLHRTGPNSSRPKRNRPPDEPPGRRAVGLAIVAAALLVGFYPSVLAPVTGLVLGVWALVDGVRARSRAHAASRTSHWTTAAIGLASVVTVAAALMFSVLLAVVDITSEYAVCKSRANTIVAAQDCVQVRDDAVHERLGFRLPLG